jgi:pimeloyl-ACP methyl ester carboxylesterase
MVDGEGPPLVLVHGVGLDHTMWDRVLDSLSAFRRVVRYDLLGHGQTPDPPGPRTLEDFVVQLLAVLDAYRLDRADIAGLSLGGMVALAAAVRHPGRFDRLALLNTVFERSPEQVSSAVRRMAIAESEGMAAVADLAVDRWFSPQWQVEHPAQVDQVRRRLADTDPVGYLKAYRVFIAGDPLMPEGAAAVTAATLAMTGELDSGSTPAMSRALAAAVTGGQVRILAGLHHLPPVEAPSTFASALSDFLDREAIS